MDLGLFGSVYSRSPHPHCKSSRGVSKEAHLFLRKAPSPANQTAKWAHWEK